MGELTSNSVAWLVLSFAIMVVAVLARLSDKVERLERRLEQLESPELDEIVDREAVERRPRAPS